MIRVLVADDHQTVREGVQTLLALEPEARIVGEAADGVSALALARELRPDLIVLDNSMPGMSGLDVARIVTTELPETAIVFLTMDPGLRDLALAAGATGYVLKDAPSNELLHAVRASAAVLDARRRLSGVRPEWRRVIELLLGTRAVTQAQIDQVLAQRAAGETVAAVFVRSGLLSQADLADVLARATGTPLVSLAPYPEISAPIDPTESRLSAVRMVDPVERDAARLIPLDLARSCGMVLTARSDGVGVLAMADPTDESAFAEAERYTRLRLTRATTTLDEIHETLERAWTGGPAAPVIWTGTLLSRITTGLVLTLLVGASLGGFFFLVRDALAPRYGLSLFALLCGVFFFLYALKYYVTSASVLLITLFGDAARFGTRAPNGNGHANGNPLKADGQANGTGQTNGQHKEGYRTLRGENLDEVGSVKVTDPWERIGEIRLPVDRQPFVSVHLALYNEKRVVDRLLQACTSFDYENYEVIVVDDSTDETVELLARWKKHPRVRVIHRSSRKGFKGGALQEALRRMNPRTEYVMIFDADFVPPADAIWHFLDYFGRLAKAKYANGNGNGHHANANGHNGNGNGNGHGAPQNGDRLAVVQGYQWHMLNASENWITKGVRAEFSGSYVLERAGQELFGAMKMISGSVYMIRADVLRKLGWSTSITEDWELTIRLYLAGYKVLYTPYIQAPAECVSKVSRLVKQRMRWAEGHTYNVKKYFWPVLRSPNLTWQEKLEFVYYAPYYLQSVLFTVATIAWILGVLVLGQKLPMWGEIFGWSLVVTNALALPLMNLTGVLLEGSLRRDALGLLSFIGLSWILVPFQAWASIKALFERKEGGWVRTPKSGVVTETLEKFHLARLMPWELPKRRRTQSKKSSGGGRMVAAAVVVLAAAGILTVGALSLRATAASGAATETDFAIPAILGTAVPLFILALGWLRLRRRMTAIVLAFTLGLGTNVVYLANAVPAQAVTDNSSVFTFNRTTSFSSPNPPNQDMLQNYTPSGSSTTCPSASGSNWVCTWTSDTFSSGQTMNAGTAQVDLYVGNNTSSGITRKGQGGIGHSSSGCGSSLGRPSVANGDVMIFACAFRGGSGVTITSVPTGWTLVGSRIDNGTTISVVVYSHVVTDATSEPTTNVWNLSSSQKLNAYYMVFSGVDNVTPTDGDAGQATASDTSHTAPSVTTTVANGRLLTFHATGICTQWTPPTGMTEVTDGTFCSQGASTNADMEVNELALASPGPTGAQTATNDAAALGVTKTVALRANQQPMTCNLTVQLSKPILYRTSSWNTADASTTVTVDKPIGLVDGDVMVAAISSGANSAPTGAPAGWNFINRSSWSTIYWKVAASEPASYTWTYGTAANMVAAIIAYSGVDTSDPIDAWAVNSGAFPQVMPSLTTTGPGRMLLAAWGGHTTSTPATWNAMTMMIEREDHAATTSTFMNLALTEQLWVPTGATGTRTNNTTPSLNSSAGHWLALKPAANSVLGSASVSITSPAGPTLKQVSISTPAVSFAAGDRLQVAVMAPDDSANCGASVSYDGATEPSKLTVATIVPEGIAGLLLLAPALPVAAAWWKRRRG